MTQWFFQPSGDLICCPNQSNMVSNDGSLSTCRDFETHPMLHTLPVTWRRSHQVRPQKFASDIDIIEAIDIIEIVEGMEIIIIISISIGMFLTVTISLTLFTLVISLRPPC